MHLPNPLANAHDIAAVYTDRMPRSNTINILHKLSVLSFVDRYDVGLGRLSRDAKSREISRRARSQCNFHFRRSIFPELFTQTHADQQRDITCAIYQINIRFLCADLQFLIARTCPHQDPIYLSGDSAVSWCSDTPRFYQGVSRNGKTPQDLTKLSVISTERLLICVHCLIQNSSCDTNK